MLEEFKESVSDLSDEELQLLLMDVRKSRRTPKASGRQVKKAAEKKGAGSAASIESLLGCMSDEDKRKLAESLGG